LLDVEVLELPEPKVPPNALGGAVTCLTSLSIALYAATVLLPEGLTTPNIPLLQCDLEPSASVQ